MELGSPVELNCESHYSPMWYFTPIKSVGLYPDRGKVLVNENPIHNGEVLTIDKVRISHSGTYTCVGKRVQKPVISITQVGLVVYGELVVWETLVIVSEYIAVSFNV